ncbi:hypothetical protein ABEB36_001984 [Hypothenemus hampei]|uniref:Uncharacterized protein n=1 Tax=Hypothenemus hampei TaxID=57062 RepID=A0ABD1FGD0_HYPHA
MSDAICKRIKQLENQNRKLMKLLETTLQITNEDTAKYIELQNEAKLLQRVLVDLENQKQHLEKDLEKQLRIIEIKLDKAIKDIQREKPETQELHSGSEQLKIVIKNLVQEKERLLSDIKLVTKKNVRLKQDIAVLQNNYVSVSSIGVEILIGKLASI